MKQILNINTILENKKSYYSVTIEPVDNYFKATFFLREKTKTGKNKVRTEKYSLIGGLHLIPEISNSTVKHLGYTRYFHLKEPDFYLNLYFND